MTEVKYNTAAINDCDIKTLWMRNKQFDQRNNFVFISIVGLLRCIFFFCTYMKHDLQMDGWINEFNVTFT